jgi:prephenate dehydratase
MNKIAYLGIPGSYSHSAALAFFKDSKDFVGVASFKDIFEAIKSGSVDAGVLPIENTLAGSIYENYDLLDHNDLHVIGEYSLRIEHCLLGHGSTSDRQDLKHIKTVYSHPKALEQCENFFVEHPWIGKVSYSDTAHAARFVKESDDTTVAAIASAQAANLYGLTVIKSSLEDDLHNYTRFLAIATQADDSKDADKCSLIVQIPHILGSLYKTLGVLESNGCNLMKIESRPLRGKAFEYIFYFDFRYDYHKHYISKILGELKSIGAVIKVLGIYKENRA